MYARRGSLEEFMVFSLFTLDRAWVSTGVTTNLIFRALAVEYTRPKDYILAYLHLNIYKKIMCMSIFCIIDM